MAAANKPAAGEEQDSAVRIDVGKFRRIVAKLGSPFDGELVNAARLGSRILESLNLRWEDLVDAYEQKEIAVEAAVLLQAENNELRERIAEYERRERGDGSAVVVWTDVRTGNPQQQAAWILAEHAAKRIYLNSFEFELLGSIAGWVGALTPHQQPVFDRILASVMRRSGGRKVPS